MYLQALESYQINLTLFNWRSLTKLYIPHTQSLQWWCQHIKQSYEDCQANIITNEHTDFINSIILVMKSYSSLRLCLYPKGLRCAISRSSYPYRTNGDLSWELKAWILCPYRCHLCLWMVKLTRKAVLWLTSTSLGKIYVAQTTFGLFVSSDIFQESLNEVLRLSSSY